ncbi:MAG TPA: PAS domain S-box protein, partial [Candidatus Omnitrophota bacterium]|nr:PAS domain S-box protein [Candidatus Omnitrophota bacterium]
MRDPKAKWFSDRGNPKRRSSARLQAEMIDELKALLDVDRDIIIIRDMEGRIVFWNRGAQDVFGWEKDYAVGRLYSELEGIRYPCPAEEIMRCLDREGRWEGEITYAPEGRDPVYLESRLCVQKDDAGVPIGIMEVHNNISDRRKAERLLRASEAHYRLLTDNISDIVGIIDRNMHFTFVGSNASRLVGFTADEVMRRDVSGMLTPESFEHARKIIAHQFEIDGRPGQDPDRSFLIEVEILTKNGEARLFELKVNFIRDEAGAPASLLGIGRDITAHKALERKLKENENLYHSFLKNFPGIAYRGLIDGSVLFFEGRVEEITGYRGDDFSASRVRWKDLIFPEDLPGIRQSWDRIHEEAGCSLEREYRIIRKDRQVRWVREHIQNRSDDSGKPAFVEGVIQDITDLKKSYEEQLWLASFPELDPHPVVEADIAGNVYYMSPAALALFPDLAAKGLKHGYLSGAGWILDRIKTEKREPFTREVEVNGLWYLQKIFAVENGTRLRIYGSDISESKLITQRLRAVNQQLMDIIDFLPDATFVVDRHRRIIAWNRALEEMTGAKKEEMVGRGDYAYAVPFYGKARPIALDLLFEPDKETESLYTYVKRKDTRLVAEVFLPRLNHGKGLFVWVNVAPFYDEKGALIGAIESIRDITEHKEAEAILRQDRQAFEQLVKSKTEELLRVQKELADSRHLSEIGALAATIAHELRNPLAAIRTAAYNIRRKSADSRLASHLDNIDKKIIESDQIINNLLSYSRIKTPRLEAVRIRMILEECLKAAADRFAKYKVKVRLKCACGKDDMILADPLHMRELFN